MKFPQHSPCEKLSRPWSTTSVLRILVSLATLMPAVAAQMYERGSCPTYYSSILFTPEVMLDLISRGEQYLVMAAGTPTDTDTSCHALSFHKEQTYTYSYRDRRGVKKILSGTYVVNFPTQTSTGSIIINDFPHDVLGVDDSGPVTLQPVAYSNGITMLVSCTSYYFSYSRRFFVFLDDEANLNWVNPRDIAMDLRKNKYLPEEMNYKLVDQSCDVCKRTTGSCVDDSIVQPIRSLFNSIDN
ncbi:uncharacterized protein LOC108672589 [Hyalella azteca]|uniref:Uncharacterized protein LOC108672589 n=1 Tax=Hyalella azteca TaxID=294128 RepID=A0A8B7NPX9_HYAAZ|nr:uncharacterized protein LOC108672589 [Hyalella azteca]